MSFRYDQLSTECLARLAWYDQQYPQKQWFPALYRKARTHKWQPVHVNWDSRSDDFRLLRPTRRARKKRWIPVRSITAVFPSGCYQELKTYRLPLSRVFRVRLERVYELLSRKSKKD